MDPYVHRLLDTGIREALNSQEFKILVTPAEIKINVETVLNFII